MTAPARTHKLTAPGEAHTIAVGQIRLTAQLTIDGGVTITIWAGTHRRAFGYNDKAEGRHAYNVIRQMASTGLSADQIADTMQANRDHARAQFRKVLEDAQEYTAGGDTATDTVISTALADEIDRLRGARERDDMAALVADMRAHLGLDCAADNPDVDPDDAPTSTPTTPAPTPTDTPAQTVDKPRNVLDAYGVDRSRANRPRLAAGSNHKLTARMVDMLAEAAERDDGTIRLDRADLRNRARAIAKRGDYLTLIHATDGVPASLYAARITNLGRHAVATQTGAVR